ncbi:HNH endonuclease [bacterium]|nr:HNH endonuclease [bacterium]
MEIRPRPYIYIEPQNDSLPEDFKLTRFDEIPCAYCGREMISLKTLNRIFYSDSDTEFTTDLIENAREKGYLLPPFQQQVLNILTQSQFVNNLTTDNQIIRNALFSSKKEIKRDIAQRLQEIYDIIQNSDETKLKELIEVNGDIYWDALLKKYNYRELLKFVRSSRYLGISSSSQNETHKEINKVIADIDETNEFSTDDYIARKGSYIDPRIFYIKLFEKITSTVDHIVAKAKGGPNRRDNFLAVCQECNSKKSDIPLPVFIKFKPEVKENIEKQIRLLKTLIPTFISNHKLNKDYENYTDEVSKFLRYITQGNLDIKA